MPRCRDKISQLMDKGVDIPNPLTIDLGEEVNVAQISGSNVKIYPGCRLYGEDTVIATGAQIGHEGPVTIENCLIGQKVELKGGYFKKAVFLDKSSMGLGAHVREGCILEEEANGAHCVGLKQTILFPFVTLGSLINFCDCLMAGGTSRKHHSEVGSSYIHFNFTPEGDKATASLIGDVPRGVMLNQAPIFLGGQGGLVGPIRLGFGNVVTAGSILRNDTPEDNKLIIGKSYRGAVTNFAPNLYTGLSRLVENNILYLANLMALEQWYRHVRQQFFDSQEFGELICAGVIKNLALAKKERVRRLRVMSEKVHGALETIDRNDKAGAGRREFHDKIQQLSELFTGDIAAKGGLDHRDRFLAAFNNHKKSSDGNYIEAVQSLPADVSQEGTKWLDQIIHEICLEAAAILPSLSLFKK